MRVSDAIILKNVAAWVVFAVTVIFSTTATASQRAMLRRDQALSKGQSVEFPLDSLAGEITAELSASATSNRNTRGLGNAGWGIEILRNGRPVVRGTVRWGNTDFGGAFDERFLRLTIDTVSAGGTWGTAAARDLQRDVNLQTGPNVLVMELHDSRADFYIGNDAETFSGSTKLPLNQPGEPLGSLALRVFALSPISVDYLTLRQKPNPFFTLWRETDSTPQDTKKDPREGLYTFLDRETDARYALLGGRYTLRVESDPQSGGYDLVYEGGAELNSDKWHTGMLKGKLIPTEFRDHFVLTWYDADAESMGREAWGDFSPEGILTLSLPLWKATLRFARK